MFVLVLAAEADETRQAITFLIVCLVGIAVLLTLLTVWYWRYTSPSRRAELATAKADRPEPAAAVVIIDDDQPSGAVSAGAESLDTGPVAAGTQGSESSEPDSSESEPPGRTPLVVPSRRERIEVVERSVSGRPVQVAAAAASSGESPSAQTDTEIDPSQADATTTVRTKGPLVGAGVTKSPTSEPMAGDGLSDDDWAAVMKSAFDKLQR